LEGGDITGIPGAGKISFPGKFRIQEMPKKKNKNKLK
jgi:hypothetical protein